VVLESGHRSECRHGSWRKGPACQHGWLLHWSRGGLRMPCIEASGLQRAISESPRARRLVTVVTIQMAICVISVSFAMHCARWLLWQP
jgi:hypothetical protein